MPCTQAELHDALQKARVQDVKTCRNELTRIRYPGITSDMIGQNVDLLELNLLALRLTMLSEDDRMGLDCLLQIEKENHTTPFPLSRLINLTFNADICLLAPQVSDPKELGALLYEGEMLSDEAMALVDTMDEDSDFRERLLELLGEQHQEEHDGVFTSRGYAEPGGDFKEVYRKGEMFCFARPSAPVVLEVSKGFFDDPSYDNDKTAILNLPAEDADIWRAVGEVDAASPDECAFRCIDCKIPSLRDTVDDAIDQEGGIGMANEFAKSLAQKEQAWQEADWIKYKALLSVAGRPNLQDAIQLMHGLEDYDLRPDVAATWDYAEVILREKYPDLPEELFQTPPGRYGWTADAGGEPRSHHRLRPAPTEGQRPVARLPAGAKGSPRLERNGDDMMENKKFGTPVAHRRLETLSVKEQTQLAAAIISRGQLKALSEKAGEERELAVRKMDPNTAKEAVNLLLALPDYEVICPGGELRAAGGILPAVRGQPAGSHPLRQPGADRMEL